MQTSGLVRCCSVPCANWAQCQVQCCRCGAFFRNFAALMNVCKFFSVGSLFAQFVVWVQTWLFAMFFVFHVPGLVQIMCGSCVLSLLHAIHLWFGFQFVLMQSSAEMLTPKLGPKEKRHLGAPIDCKAEDKTVKICSLHQFGRWQRQIENSRGSFTRRLFSAMRLQQHD